MPPQTPAVPCPTTDAEDAMVCAALAAAASIHDDTEDHCLSGPLASFTSSVVPRCTLAQFAAHLSRQIHQKEAVRLAAVLLLRVWKANNTPPTKKTVHRLLLACLSVAMKAHYDDFYVTRYLACVASVSPSELSDLECRVVQLTNWNVQVRARQLKEVSQHLAKLGEQVKCNASELSVGRRMSYFIDDAVWGDLRPFTGPQVLQLAPFREPQEIHVGDRRSASAYLSVASASAVTELG